MQSQDTPLKICTKCGAENPATRKFFRSHVGHSDGLTSACIECERKRDTSRVRDPEEARARSARYNERHRELVNARELRRYYSRPARRAYLLEWSRAHPDVGAAKSRNRKARKNAADGSHSAVDVRVQYVRQKGRCYWCHKKVGHSYHVDHVMPIVKGGSNGPENIVIACPFCNESKGAKHPMEWAGVLC
jgi:5-methylcytosine-specific restriction endonuclease McrA